mmetsp:Transcript_47083/g.81035  ORF Transcript_47083/g.81035 Transcript_47083/m.81035 type:complete len:466 (+) Transcript_47083:84-1481(+)
MVSQKSTLKRLLFHLLIVFAHNVGFVINASVTFDRSMVCEMPVEHKPAAISDDILRENVLCGKLRSLFLEIEQNEWRILFDPRKPEYGFCDFGDPRKTYQNGVLKHQNRTGELNVMVSKSCLAYHSFGNRLSKYFESMICALRSGFHFFAIPKLMVGKNASSSWHENAPAFLERLPAIIVNPHSKPVSERLVTQTCSPGWASTSPHEIDTALWTHETKLIRTILDDALKYHLEKLSLSEKLTLIDKSDLSNIPVGFGLPLIPDVAIHYRCGDNFQGHYGFVPFPHLADRIPDNAKTIYVLAESEERGEGKIHNSREMCVAIFDALFEYLSSRFPNSAIIIKRGTGGMLVDFARLSFAKVVICSPSTFCLWAAVGRHGEEVYFPGFKSVAHSNTSLSLGFKWINQPILNGLNAKSGGVSSIKKNFLLEKQPANDIHHAVQANQEETLLLKAQTQQVGLQQARYFHA